MSKALEAMRQYQKKAHAIQSAIQFEISTGGEASAGASPKHLRTGLNLVMCDLGSLLDLLVKKGIITDDEVIQATLDGLDGEIARLEKKHPGMRFS
jgi:hypothetical protein